MSARPVDKGQSPKDQETAAVLADDAKASEPPDVAADPAPAPAPADTGVPALLRAARERLGQDVPGVAEVLRIRASHIYALEDGRIGDLPGQPYALGFVRSYAAYLGLDAEDVVRRFKAEAGGLNRKDDLNFPTPEPDSFLPSGVMVVGGLVMAALVYAAWTWLASDESVESMITGLPADIAGLVGYEPAAPDVSPVEAPATPEPAPEETPPVVDTPPEPAPVEEQPAPTAELVVEEAVPVATPAVEDEAEVIAEQETAPVTEAMPLEAPEGPRVFGDPGASRVTVLATADCWVEVNEGATILLSRVLRAGDRYAVPDRPGLGMVVGNAGALSIEVDGTPVPPIGPPGAVRRNILLEPGPLRAGTAVGAATPPPESAETPAPEPASVSTPDEPPTGE